MAPFSKSMNQDAEGALPDPKVSRIKPLSPGVVKMDFTVAGLIPGKSFRMEIAESNFESSFNSPV